MPQPSVPVVNPHDYVTCAKHNARRLARFCTPCPVYNADHEIIDYVFECRENQLCSSAQRQASSSHGAHVGGRADTQEGAFGRRGAHEGDTGEGMNTESAPAQPMVFDASSSSNSNTTGAHSNARYMAGGMQGNRNDAQQQQQQTGTTLFSVSFTAPSETKEVRNAELGKSTTTTTTDETKTGQEDSSAHNATAKEAAATQERAEISAMGQTTTATTTMSAQDKEGTHEEEKEELCGNNNNNNEEGTRPTHTIAGTVVAVVVAGGVEVTGGMSERPATASSPTQFTSPRAPLRYYDMLQRAGNAPHGGAHANSIGGGFGHGGAMASLPKKVCWYCGLTGHEKQECTNTLCRSCHARRPGNPHSSSGSNSMPAYHTCVPVRDVSPFIVVPRLLPQGRDAMPAVRCVSCGAYGHFDCSAATAALGAASPPSSSASSQVRANNAEGQDHNNSSNSAAAVVTKGTLNCCFCGGRGHTAFDCYERKRMNPDRWEQRVLALAGEPENNESRYNNNNSNYGSYSAGNASYRQGGRGNAESERRSYYQSGTGSNYSQPYTSSRGGNTSNSRSYSYEDTYNRQDASSIAAQTTRYTSPAAPYNTPYHQARSETNYAGREAPAPPPPSTTAAASSSSSRRRPREVYENEYSAQTRGGYAYNTGSTITGTNDERGTLRAYREERTGTSPAAALREYDTTLTVTSTNNDNNNSSNAVRREERHRSTSGSHHSHHSHHRHHRSERGEDYEDRHGNEGTRETSSRRARHDSRRRGPNNTNKDNGVGDEEEDYTPRSARRGNVSGDEVNYAGRTRRHEEGNYGRYNTNNNSEGMARNASHQQQQQHQSSYNAYTYGGNAGRAERNNFTRDDRTYNTTSSYHHHQQQQQTSQPRYASPSYRDKRGGSNTTNTISSSYNARAEEMPYGRHANEARQYGYSQPQRWRSEANASRYAPQSRTGQYQRGGRNNNNNNNNRYNDDESDLY